ncbi:MAG TPA: hypothetical protein VMF11_07765 [Candidatus Baltobacteraceae bacterium]|nr:hypothetical protein [Candidatus Baltobacteraceae bacterium]
MTSRKDFLIAGTLAAAAIPVAAGAKGAKLDFDLTAFTELLDGAQSHKHLFASVEIDGGEVFGAMRNTLSAYHDVGVASGDVFPVAVLYHGPAILLGFDDWIWNRYVIPFEQKNLANRLGKQIASVRSDGGTGNPCLRRQGGKNDASISALIADAGAYFFICNNAAHGFAAMFARTVDKPEDTVYDDLTRHLVPNAMLVPAGVWAIHAIQEQRFTLLQTSLAPNA